MKKSSYRGYKKRTRRRNYKYKYRKYRKTSRYNLSPIISKQFNGGIAQRMFAKLVFYGKFVCDSSLSYEEFGLSGNGAYDPEIWQITGRQPLYFDQFMTLYNRYRVHSSRVILTGNPTTSTTNYRMLVYPLQYNSYVFAASLDRSVEKLNCKTCTVGALSGRSYNVLKHFARTQRICSVKDIADNDNYSGNGSSNPVEEWAWIVGVGSIAGSTFATYNFSVEYKITYYVEFFDPVDVVTS